MVATTHLLYLHGFRSSPQSAKARITGAWMQAHRPEVVWCCPQLPPSPAAALALIERSLAEAAREPGRAPTLVLHGGGAPGLVDRLPSARLLPTLVLDGLADWAALDGHG